MVVAEAWRSLTASLSTTLAAALTVLIGMFLVGLLIAFWTFADSWSNEQKEKLVVKVFFCTPDAPAPCEQEEATASQINAVRAKLDGDSRVKSYQFVSKSEALDIMKKEQPAMVDELDLESTAELLHRHPGQGRVHGGDRGDVHATARGGREGDVRGGDREPRPEGCAGDQRQLPASPA